MPMAANKLAYVVRLTVDPSQSSQPPGTDELPAFDGPPNATIAPAGTMFSSADNRCSSAEKLPLRLSAVSVSPLTKLCGTAANTMADPPTKTPTAMMLTQTYLRPGVLTLSMPIAYLTQRDGRYH